MHELAVISVFILAFSVSFNCLKKETILKLRDEDILTNAAALEKLRAEAEAASAYYLLDSVGLSQKGQHYIEDGRLEAIFKQYCLVYKRSYISDVKEYNLRKVFFRKSLKRQAALNAKESLTGSSARYGINKFSDWSEEEFKGLLKSFPARNGTDSGREFTHADKAANGCTYYRKDPPKHVDWRENGMVTTIKNQGKCGSCWAFVATEQVESYWAIAGKPLAHYSVQEFISCAPSLGCNGGNTCQALAWLNIAPFNKTRYHLVHDSEYPYEAKDTKCKYGGTSETGATISAVCGCVSMVGKEDIMLRVLAQRGPLGVNVNSIQWHDYISGVIQRHCSDQTMNHAVQIVGYDLSGPVPYWIVRNTWGKDFGENGYLRIKYGGNLCGLAEEPSFVVV